MSWLHSSNLELNSAQTADCMSHKGISDVLIAIETTINGIIIHNSARSIRYHKKRLQILCAGDNDKNWQFIIKYDQGTENKL